MAAPSGLKPTAEQVFALIADQPGAVWLDGGQSTDGWSILAWSPEDVMTQGSDWPTRGRSLLGQPQSDADVPFSGGLIGYLGFGAGRWVSPVPAQADTPEPELWLGRYRGALCFRHQDGRWFAVGEPDVVDQGRALLDGATVLAELAPPPNASVRTTPRQEYEAGVVKILKLITEGDCYQVNLTRPVHIDGAGDPWMAYRRLRARSAPEFGAFLRLDEHQTVLSNSPELFLEVDGVKAHSLPIKGTRPRGATAAEDARLHQALTDSPKDRAELTMIVDLVRNDLGRIAIPGSVRTSERVVSAHANVYHAAQSVRATLEDGLDVWDALAACFPPGSVTGAPKVRACERIRQLEDEPRGVYCGAIGFVGAQESRWNVAIRTAIFSGSQARYHVGGGIVAASTPSEEWEETLAKGSELARALVGRLRT